MFGPENTVDSDYADSLGPEFCEFCGWELTGEDHDLQSCEHYLRQAEQEQAEFALNDAISHLAKNQPLRQENWDQDTREAAIVLTRKWLEVVRGSHV